LARCAELAEADIEKADHYHSASRARIIAGLFGFFHLDPIPRWTRSGGRAQSLRHDTLKAHPAGLLEDDGAILVGVLAEDDAESR
jgi:hypothetical protein